MPPALPPSTNWEELAEDAIRVQGEGHTAMHPTGSGFGPVLLIGVCVLLLHMLLFSLLTSVLITHLRRINGVAMLTSAQKAWQTTLRLIDRSSAIMTGHRTNAAARRGNSWLWLQLRQVLAPPRHVSACMRANERLRLRACARDPLPQPRAWAGGAVAQVWLLFRRLDSGQHGAVELAIGGRLQRG